VKPAQQALLTADGLVAECAADQHGVLTAAQARDVGLSDTQIQWRVRRDRLVRLQPGVYLVPRLLDDYSHLQAICLRCPEAVVSHQAAAWLLGLDVDGQSTQVTVPQSTRLRVENVFRSTDLDRAVDVTSAHGLPVTNATRTLADLGAVSDRAAVERALESALRQGQTTVPRLRARLEALSRRGRPGPPLLRAILDSRPKGSRPTANEMETRLLQILTQAGLPQPVRQHPIGGGPKSAKTRKLDLAYPDLHIAIEFDGFEVHGTPSALRRDLARQNEVVLSDWLVLRYTWADVWGEADRIVAEVRAARKRARAIR
jgi:hypothetical protein